VQKTVKVGTSTISPDLLHRRSDLSTFLVHFTRDLSTGSARDNLLSIVNSRRIEARNVHGMLRDRATVGSSLADTQRCVCLTETPIEHAWMMCRPIANRQNQFANYGIAFPKIWARRGGVNPVWYVDITPGHDFLTKPINELIEIAAAGEARAFVPNGHGGEALLQRVPLERSQVTQIVPFIELMGSHNGAAPYRKEFWWEREWRKVGSLPFTWANVVTLFAPAADHILLRTEMLGTNPDPHEPLPPLLDPTMSCSRSSLIRCGDPRGRLDRGCRPGSPSAS
jgi:Putative abortive phage resistance protein AbiGi, antitoxin